MTITLNQQRKLRPQFLAMAVAAVPLAWVGFLQGEMSWLNIVLLSAALMCAGASLALSLHRRQA
jgi:hypothetical protein